MSRLIDRDYSDVDVLELQRTRTSARQFWAALLFNAMQNGVERIVYCPQLNRLSVVVDGAQYEMVPPHKDLQPWTLGIGRELAVGHRWLERIYRVIASITHRPYFGQIAVDIQGQHGTWTVECRLKPMAELVLTTRTVA